MQGLAPKTLRRHRSRENVNALAPTFHISLPFIFLHLRRLLIGSRCQVVFGAGPAQSSVSVDLQLRMHLFFLILYIVKTQKWPNRPASNKSKIFSTSAIPRPQRRSIDLDSPPRLSSSFIDAHSSIITGLEPRNRVRRIPLLFSSGGTVFDLAGRST